MYRPPIGEHMEDTIRETAAAATITNTTTSNVPTEDPPPKYTPPPSYTTATGARIAKFLRQSIRRSVRRLANVLGESSSSRQQNETQTQPPPPDYNAVLVEMNRSTVTDSPDRRTQELAIASQSSALTAADVASILRNSFRRSTVRNAFRSRVLNENNNTGSMSAENLVDNVAPVGETSLVLEQRTTEEDGDETKKVDDSSVI